MDLVQRLPFVLSIFMAIIIGVTSNIYSKNHHEIYYRMIIGMLVFFVLGIFIRSALVSIMEETEKNILAKQNEQKELDAQNAKKAQSDKNSGNSSSKLDLRVDEDSEKLLFDDEFSPLKVSEVIKTME